MVGALAHAGATRSLTDSEQQLFSAACKTATKVRAHLLPAHSPSSVPGCHVVIHFGRYASSHMMPLA